jgi:hypothetical protein
MYTVRDQKPIIHFLRGIGPDYKGRFYSDMAKSNDGEMEECHDQIQWMFPIHEGSRFAMVCPIVDQELVDKAMEFPSVQYNINAAAIRMSDFFGIGKYTDKSKQINWCNENNHNLLRITRIIRCLRIFRLESQADNFHRNVVRVLEEFPIIGDTKSYWDKALQDPIWHTLR